MAIWESPDSTKLHRNPLSNPRGSMSGGLNRAVRTISPWRAHDARQIPPITPVKPIYAEKQVKRPIPCLAAMRSKLGKIIRIFPVLHGPALRGELIAELVGGGPVLGGARGPAGFGKLADPGGDVGFS